MYKNIYVVLRAVMESKHATIHDIASYAGITVQSAYNKLAGRTDWTLTEARRIQQGLQCDETLEILFWK